MFLLLTIEFLFYLLMFPICIALSVLEGIVRIPICIIFKLPVNNMFFLSAYTQWGEVLGKKARKYSDEKEGDDD